MSFNNLKIIESISLDFYNNNIKTINIKQYDTQSRYVKISCTEHGKFYALNPNAMAAYVRCKKPDGFDVFNNCTILDDGTVLLELTQQMLAVTGKCTMDIMIIYTNIVADDESGDVELTEKSLSLNALKVEDDNAGNVSLSVDNENDLSIYNLQIDSIQDIYNLQIPILSTMTFYVNILPSAINPDNIISTEEYQGLANQFPLMVAATEYANIQGESAQHWSTQAESATANANEQAEYAKTQSTEAKVQAEQAQIQAESARIWAGEAQTAAGNAQAAADKINSIVSGDVVMQNDIANNLSTETPGMVLDAVQGKVLKDLIDAIPSIYCGTEDPNIVNPEGSKDGDVYMLIIEDVTGTVGE